MKKEYQTIILGATFQGCSLAAGKEDCLILEHSIHAGSDFIYSALPGIAPLREPCFPESRELQEDLISAKALTENGMQMAALAPYFSKWCLKEKLNILFSADPIAVKENTISIMTVAGKKEFSFEKLIDTRPESRKKKFLTGFALVPEGVPPGKYGKISFWKCEPLSRMALLLELPGEASWSDARKSFREAWALRPEIVKEGKLLWTSSAFLYDRFGNYLEAMEEGLKGVEK